MKTGEYDMTGMQGMTSRLSVIETPESFEKALQGIETYSDIALDLEADSLHHYRDRVCLIQISTPLVDYVIDPIRINDLDPLRRVFGNAGICKIIHGADFDLRSLDRDFGFHLTNIFDTKVASELLGITRVGLAHILKERFDVDLSKKYQKHNWSRRPIRRDAVEYAAMDTRYLIRLKEQLMQELLSAGRLQWAIQEFEHLQSFRWSPSRRERWGFWTLVDVRRMKPGYVSAVQTLYGFREKIAEERDLPPFRVFTDTTLLELAGNLTNGRLPPEDVLTGVSPEYKEKLMRLISGFRKCRNHTLPQIPDDLTESDSVYDRSLFAKLKSARDQAATTLGIDPSTIAGNKVLKKVACELAKLDASRLQSGELPGLRRWQSDLIRSYMS